jgi:hypothetical protein
MMTKCETVEVWMTLTSGIEMEFKHYKELHRFCEYQDLVREIFPPLPQ